MRYGAHISSFWLKFGSLSPAVTLKIKSRSPKPNQLFIMSQCYTHANFVKIHPQAHKISCKQESVTLMQTPTCSGVPTFTICMVSVRKGMLKEEPLIIVRCRMKILPTRTTVPHHSANLVMSTSYLHDRLFQSTSPKHWDFYNLLHKNLCCRLLTAMF